MYKKKVIILGLALMLSIGMAVGWDRIAQADETVQSLAPQAAEVTVDQINKGTPSAILHLNAVTDIYAQKYHDYFWIRNNEQDISYTSVKDDISSSGNTEALLVDCRFYFPMELVADKFGEEMDWDGSMHRSYVLHDGKRIYVSTIRIGEIPFVKIRDFELLGYKIQYQGVENHALVDIAKN